MSALDHFIEAHMHEQDKLIEIGIIKGSNVHALSMHESSKASNPKTKQKGNGKVHA